MRAHRLTLSAVALLAGMSVAAAQQQAPANQATNPIGDGPFKSQQGGKEEPGSHASGANNDANNDAVFVNGRLDVPGAPQDSQTVPSKYSKRNAEIDALPIMAMPLGLSEAQKLRIAESVAKSDAPVEAISAKAADILPVDTRTQESAEGHYGHHRQREIHPHPGQHPAGAPVQHGRGRGDFEIAPLRPTRLPKVRPAR